MKIFYFTGTGNTLHMAKLFAEKFKNVELFPITKAVFEKQIIQEDVIGIFLPVYMFRAPRIVCKFLKQISSADYIFAVATNGGSIGKVFTQMDTILKKNGQKLNSGYSIKLPDNYIPYGPPPEGDELKELFIEAEKKINTIIDSTNNRVNHFDNETRFYKKYIWPGLFYKLGYVLGSKLDTSFKVGNKCNSCEICKKVCPVNNITFKNSKPFWNHKCENCFACIQWCPKDQIEYGSKTKGIKRYTNSAIKINEIIAQK